MGRNGIKTGILRARTTDTVSVWIAAVLIPLFLIAPALWNGYPLLQWDTGGYLARWYEGYLVPSRSTVFGLYLHFGVDSDFWLNLGIQALATLWILQLCLRVLNLAQPFRLLAISLLLILTTALPWLASLLLTDIFAGLSVLALFLLIAHGEKISAMGSFRCSCSRRFRPRPTALRWACCSGFACSASSPGLSSARRFRCPGYSRAASPWLSAARCSWPPITDCPGSSPGRRAASASPSGECCRMASSPNI
jgi:hypothetical protein